MRYNLLALAGALLLSATSLLAVDSAVTVDTTTGAIKRPVAAKTFREANGVGSPTGPVVLPHLVAKINAQQSYVDLAPVVWWDFGDSMATQTEVMMGQFYKMLGFGGAALDTCYAALSGGASYVTETTPQYWINARHYAVPATETVTFGFDFSGGVLSSVRATTLKVFYVKDAGGVGVNTFKFQYSDDDGGSWHDIGSTIDTNNASTIGAVATTTRTVGSYRVRALGVAGTCKIIGAALINDDEGGIVWAKTSRGALSLTEMIAPSTAITQPIITALEPTVFSYAERPELDWSLANLTTLRTRCLTASPDADWIFQGMSPVDPDDQDNDRVIALNETIRAWALANHDFYFNGYDPFGSWEQLESAGMADGVHLTLAGNRYIVSRFLAETGLLDTVSGAAANLRRRTLSNGQQIIVPAASETTSNELVIGTSKELGGQLGYYDGDGTFRGNLTVLGSDGNGTWYSPHALVLGIPGMELIVHNLNGFRDVYLGTARELPEEQFHVQYGITGAKLVARTGGYFYGSSGTTSVRDLAGSGTPEGNVTAPIGSTYRRTDGGAGTSFYVKESGTGNTGWVGK